MSEIVEDGSETCANAKGLVLSEFLPYRLVLLGHRVSRRLGRVYERENLTVPEWRVLAVISQAEAMAARDVAAQTPMDKMAVSRAVAALEDKGLVARCPDAADRRIVRLSLTAEGRTMFGRVALLARSYEDGLVAALGPEDARALRRALDRLDAALGERGDDG